MQIIIEAFLLGLVGGVIPGSILTILLVSVMQGGFTAGLRAFLWCVLAEVTVVLVLLGVLLSLPINPAIFTYLAIIGGGVLCYFAYQIFQLSKIDQPNQVATVFSPRKIFVLSATNAPLYIFWITVCAPLIWQLAEQFEPFVAAGYFMLVFELGWALSTFAVLIVFITARRVLTDPRVMSRVYFVIALFMTLLAFRMWYSALQDLGLF